MQNVLAARSQFQKVLVSILREIQLAHLKLKRKVAAAADIQFRQLLFVYVHYCFNVRSASYLALALLNCLSTLNTFFSCFSICHPPQRPVDCSCCLSLSLATPLLRQQAENGASWQMLLISRQLKIKPIIRAVPCCHNWPWSALGSDSNSNSSSSHGLRLL